MPDNELNGDRSRRLQRIDTHVQNWLRQHRWGEAVTALGAVLVFALGSLAYGHWAPNAPQMIAVELAGSVSTISGLVKGQGAA